MIERIAHGIDFSSVVTVNAAGNGYSLVTQYYTFTDNSPFNGSSYYRLKQVDKNGEFNYYNIVQVTISKESSNSHISEPGIYRAAYKQVMIN